VKIEESIRLDRMSKLNDIKPRKVYRKKEVKEYSKKGKLIDTYA